MTDEKYIKMCEKAEKIQELYNPNGHNCLWDYTLRWDWDRDSLKYKGYQDYGGRKQHIFESYDGWLWGAIWLPRQEDLQGMIGLHPILDSRKSKLASLLSRFWNWYLNTNGEQDSMNQLWLSFVMYENHHKVWDGEDWIKGVSL